MKISHGMHPAILPLPPLESGQSDAIEIEVKDSGKFDLTMYPDLFKEYSAIKREGLKLQFPSSTKNIHPLLQNSQKHWKGDKPENDSRFSPGRWNCAHIRVSPGTVDRALKVMHALFTLFESQGFVVSAGDYKAEGTCVRILGESLRISLKEKIKHNELVQSSPFGRKYEFYPLGELVFETEDYYAAELQHKRQDTPSSPLEERMFEINEGLIETAVRRRITHIKQEEEDRREAEEQKAQEAEARNRKAEQTRFEKLLKDAKDWQTSQTIRSYINVVRISVKGDETPEAKVELEQWIGWAEQRADELDPIESEKRSQLDDIGKL
jgi:hypothetical protein